MAANLGEIEKEKLFDEIIDDISENGTSLFSALKNRMSSKTFYEFLDASETRIKKYARATELRAEMMAEEILEISDNTIEGVVIETDDNGRTKEKKGDMLGHRRLQVDTRKWLLSKLHPKKYGDKIEVDTNQKQTIEYKNVSKQFPNG